MDLGTLVEKSFAYAKEGLDGMWAKWLLLILLAALPAVPMIFMIFVLIMAFAFNLPMLLMLLALAGFIILIILFACPIMGYAVRVMKGTVPAPEVENLGPMFTDGLRLFVVQLFYALPLIIVAVLIFGGMMMPAFTAMAAQDPSAIMKFFMGLAAGILVLLILGIIIGLVEAIAIVRFARMDSIGEAFNFGAILGHIGRIGWGAYIIAFIALIFIVGIFEIIVSNIPAIGGIILLILEPPLLLFSSRYLSLLYDQGEPVAAA
jgi:hypothetical protein